MSEKPAVAGGRPQRATMLPYGRQAIDDEDVRAVSEALRGEFLTTGPTVERFEQAFARAVGAKHAVAASNGTVALHLMARALGLGKGDRVVTTPMTFVATSNAALFCDATPDFADVDEETGLLAPSTARSRIGSKTKALFTVDYTGQPVDYAGFRDLADDKGIAFASDAAHALGAEYKGRRVGAQADVTMFSLHPVKHITTGEGGMVTTDREDLAERLRLLRNHGMDREVGRRLGRAYYYEIVELGYNYRLTDIQAALGLSQLKKLDGFVARRERIAQTYTQAFRDLPGVTPPVVRPGVRHAWHLYMLRLNLDELDAKRDEVFAALRAENIGVHVHYVPVHLHPLYRERLGTRPGQFPAVERFYERLLTLPLFPTMTDRDVQDVIEAVEKVVSWFAAKRTKGAVRPKATARSRPRTSSSRRGS